MINSEVTNDSKITGAFGEVLQATPEMEATTSPLIYGYTGRQFEPETGLYFYRNRVYDQNSGRFMTKDPIGFRGGDTNLYRYVSNNPLMYVDPMGTDQRLVQEALFHTILAIDNPDKPGAKVYVDFKPAKDVTLLQLAWATVTGGDVPGRIEIRHQVLPLTFDVPGSTIKTSSEVDRLDIERAQRLSKDPNLRYSLTGSANSCVGFAAGF